MIVLQRHIFDPDCAILKHMQQKAVNDVYEVCLNTYMLLCDSLYIYNVKQNSNSAFRHFTQRYGAQFYLL